MRYRTKPNVIEAIQFVGGQENIAELREFTRQVDERLSTGQPLITTARFVAKSATAVQAWNYVKGEGWGGDIRAAVYDELHETWVGVKHGQWIIKGTVGEFYPCDPEVFEAKYELADCGHSPLTPSSCGQCYERIKANAAVVADPWPGDPR